MDNADELQNVNNAKRKGQEHKNWFYEAVPFVESDPKEIPKAQGPAQRE